jgi:thiamine biosynthesis protein ThiI
VRETADVTPGIRVETDSAAPPPALAAYPRRILLRCPELTLKGRNRGEFERALVANVGLRLRRTGLGWPVHYAHGRVYVDVVEPAAEGIALDALCEVTGVDSLAPALWLRPTLTGQNRGELERAPLEDAVVALAAAELVAGGSFAVRVNRVDKRLGRNSQQIESWLGAAVRARTSWERVDLEHPDRTFHLDVYPDGIYLSAARRRGFGGLPVGTAGRVLALLSGGIDSPVAAFLMAKRGCAVDLFHLTASHSQLRDESSPVFKLAARLSRFTLRSRLFAAPSTRFDLALGDPGTGYEAILFRRFLSRAAQALAGGIGAGALVTGDSLGQVASQTMENLASTAAAVTLPVLRPLIAFNKEETIALARRLGTFEPSIEPYKDCCALLARHPRTRSEPARLQEMEDRLLPGVESLVRETLEDAVVRRFECGLPAGEWEGAAALGISAR